MPTFTRIKGIPRLQTEDFRILIPVAMAIVFHSLSTPGRRPRGQGCHLDLYPYRAECELAKDSKSRGLEGALLGTPEK